MAGWTFLCEKAGDVSVDVPTCFWVQSQLDPHPGTLYLWQLKEGPESANLLREWRKTKKTENMIPGVCLDFVGAVIVLPKPIEAPVGSSWVPGRKASRVAAHWHTSHSSGDFQTSVGLDVQRPGGCDEGKNPTIKVSRDKCLFDFRYLRNQEPPEGVFKTI